MFKDVRCKKYANYKIAPTTWDIICTLILITPYEYIKVFVVVLVVRRIENVQIFEATLVKKKIKFSS